MSIDPTPERNLLARCVARRPGAWSDFVDRYVGLIYHVIQHCARARDMTLTETRQRELCQDIFAWLLADDMQAGVNALGDVALYFAQCGKEGNFLVPLGHAYPFLTMMGKVTSAWLLFWGAGIVVIVVARHLPNIQRLLAGSERKVVGS